MTGDSKQPNKRIMEISGFCHGVNEMGAFVGFYTA
jgi:hypothetical protein